MADDVWIDKAREMGRAYIAHRQAAWAAAFAGLRVAPQEHAPQERNVLLPRDFMIPHVTDEDC